MKWDITNYNLEFAELKKFITSAAGKTFNGTALFGSGTMADVTTSTGFNSLNHTNYKKLFDANGDATEVDGTYHTWVAEPAKVTSDKYAELKAMRTDIGLITKSVASIDQDKEVTAPAYATASWETSVAFWEAKLGKSYTDSKNHAGTVAANGDVASTGGTVLTAAQIDSYKELALDIQNYVKNKIPAKMSVTDSSDGSTYDLNNANVATITTAIASGGDINAALTSTNAKTYNSKIVGYISTLAEQRANVGANISRLNMVDSQLAVYGENLAAANSRIADVDVATESANYAKQQILVQSGTAMLAQANLLSQSALRLLQ